MFVVGGEFTLFMNGIVEGRNAVERMANIARASGSNDRRDNSKPPTPLKRSPASRRQSTTDCSRDS